MVYYGIECKIHINLSKRDFKNVCAHSGFCPQNLRIGVCSYLLLGFFGRKVWEVLKVFTKLKGSYKEAESSPGYWYLRWKTNSSKSTYKDLHKQIAHSYRTTTQLQFKLINQKCILCCCNRILMPSVPREFSPTGERPQGFSKNRPCIVQFFWECSTCQASGEVYKWVTKYLWLPRYESQY